MKVVILAGGKGTRLAELTDAIPKPMVQIAGRTILGHIVDIYRSQGFHEFIIAAGYKQEMIDEWARKEYAEDYGITIDVVDTGKDTQTGGRLGRLKPRLSAGPFMMTYGDGVANVNLTHVWNYHTSMRPSVTLTAVRPPARFGSLRLDGAGKVMGFHEKSQTMEGWVNGGFMVISPMVLDLCGVDETNFERDVLPELAEAGQLQAYFHAGFWQCMDTIRDVKLLRDLAKEGPPWIGKA